MLNYFQLSLFYLFFFISKFKAQQKPQLRSVPIPLHMDEMLNSGRQIYDKQSTPTQNIGLPTFVKLAMYIEGIGSFRTHTMDFQLDVYLQQFWRDPRLAHNEKSRILIRDKAILNRIWHPDVYFANARIAQFHEVTQPNFLLWIDPDGSILYDTRVSMVVICAMNLKNFPLDSQWCHLRILSYAYDIHHLKIEWVDQEPITKNMNITMSDMDIVKLVPGTCDGNYSTGVWSCVTAEFFVARELTHHILQTYVPTTLIVVISWFSFWLDVEAVPARVSLAITTLLTLSTQANSVKNSLPEVSYMKSLDLFLAVSVLFVFGVLIEFTIVNYTQRNATMAAAGLLDEKEDNNILKCNCIAFICKIINQFCKQIILKKEPKQSTSKKQSFWHNISPRNWKNKNLNKKMMDLEKGKIYKDNRKEEEGNLCFNRKLSSSKKFLAMEREKTTANSFCGWNNSKQLQIISSSNLTNNKEITTKNLFSNVPIIICKESIDENEEEINEYGLNLLQRRDCQLKQRVVDDKREAARLANWAKPELSCEALSFQKDQKLKSTQDFLLVNQSENIEVRSEDYSTAKLSTPPALRKTVSTLFSSKFSQHSTPNKQSAVQLKCLGAESSSSPSAKLTTESPISRSLSRRASAMASLLDPINIGSDGRRESFTSTTPNVGSLTSGDLQQTMTPRSKWRHAIRKLQMNKREAGRIQAKKIDAWSRWAFPLSYFSFHAAYWYYYLRLAV